MNLKLPVLCIYNVHALLCDLLSIGHWTVPSNVMNVKTHKCQKMTQRVKTVR